MSRTLVQKVRRAHAEGRLGMEIANGLRPSVRGLAWLLHDPSAGRVVLHCPDYVTPPTDAAERVLVDRIFRSFRQMKADQQTAPDAERYRPSSLWQQQLDQAFAPLNAGLHAGDVEPFHLFLANFGTWREYHGIEYSTFIRKNMATPLSRKYLRNDVFDRQLKIWRWMYDGRKPLTALTYPMHGNQAGAFIDDVFVGVNSYFKEVYGSIMAGIVSDRSRPVVAELGAGYGKLAYFALRDRAAFAFVDFDLPETLCVAAYYLMKVWPHRRALLYGEGEYRGARSHEDYDLIFMPSFAMPGLGRSSVDLFVNHTSLGEMTREAVTNYVGLMTDSTRYFFHLNHDIHPNVYTDGAPGPLGWEYPVPADRFKLLYRYPDIGHMLFTGGFDFKYDIFAYLYERIAD